MTGDEVLFDTNAFIAWSNADAALARRLVNFEALALPVVGLGELVLGALNSARTDENLARLERNLLDFRLLPCDGGTASRYGEIALSLRRKGRPIPQNDMWIGAIARQHGLPIITRDTHFREIDGLTIIDW